MSSTTPTLHSDSRSAEPHERSRRTPATGMGLRTLLAHGIEQFPEAVRKLDPRLMVLNPVMLVVEIAAVLKAARQVTEGRVIAVVQPHRYTRLRDLMDRLGKMGI